jgi:drug/metabolite transporter (DMT)-like permease
MRRQAAVWILLVCGTAFAVVAIVRPELLSGQRALSLLYATMLLAFVGSAAWAGARANLGATLYQAVIWLAIIVALAGGYRLWQSWT